MKNKYFFLFIALITMFFLSYKGVGMYKQQFYMYVRVIPIDDNDPEWPSKRKWFDARKWLNTSQYIKVNAVYLLNTKYTSVDNFNNFRIARAIHMAIKESVKIEDGLSDLSQMEDDEFYEYIKDKLSCEYLRTKFDSEELKPVVDYFLFFFSHNGKNYEIEITRKPYKNEFSFIAYGFVHEAGYWHEISPAGYSYRDFVEGKPISGM